MQKLKQIKNNVTNSWTCRHPREILILSLITVIVIQAHGDTIDDTWIKVASAFTHEVTYTKPLNEAEQAREIRINQKAIDTLEANRDILLEQYRQNAIQEEYAQLLELSELSNSPFIDHEELKIKYGY